MRNAHVAAGLGMPCARSSTSFCSPPPAAGGSRTAKGRVLRILKIKTGRRWRRRRTFQGAGRTRRGRRRKHASRSRAESVAYVIGGGLRVTVTVTVTVAVTVVTTGSEAAVTQAVMSTATLAVTPAAVAAGPPSTVLQCASLVALVLSPGRPAKQFPHATPHHIVQPSHALVAGTVDECNSDGAATTSTCAACTDHDFYSSCGLGYYRAGRCGYGTVTYECLACTDHDSYSSCGLGYYRAGSCGNGTVTYECNACTNRPANSAYTSYYMIESGSCGDAVISTQSECEAAAMALLLSEKTAQAMADRTSSSYPPGCSFFTSLSYLSVYGSGSSGPCSSTYQCICMLTPPTTRVCPYVCNPGFYSNVSY